MFIFRHVLRSEEGGDEGQGGSAGGMMGQGDTGSEGNTPPSWSFADGVAGSGDKPEWFNDTKYKSVSAQAEAYRQLEKRFGGFTGAPQEYTAPEGLEDNAEINMLKATIGEFGKELNMSQEAYNKMVGGIVTNVTQMREQLREAQVQEAIKSIDNFDNRRTALAQTAQTILTPAQFDAVNDLMVTPQAFEAVEAMMASVRGASIPGRLPQGAAESPSELMGALNKLDPTDMKGRAVLLEKLNKSGGEGRLI